MPVQQANWDYQWGQVVGQAWADDAFKQRLFADPTAALKEYGLEMPAGLQVKVLEDTDEVPEDTADLRHLVLPPKPPPEDLSEEELHRLTATPSARCGCEYCHCHSCERCSCERCSCERCRC